MGFDPKDFLAVARALDGATTTPPVEASLRTCRGRAYYAAYLVARGRLESAGYVCPPGYRGGRHQWLLDRLLSGNDDVRASGKALQSLYAERIDADYTLGDSSRYTPQSGRLAAVRAEQWIRTFMKLTGADIATIRTF